MPNSIQGSDGDQFVVHTTQRQSLGQEMRFSDGRRFRYCRADPSTAVVVGKFYQGAVPVTAHVLQTATAAAAGDRTVTLALGATLVYADQYRDGYLVVDLATNTGFGYIYQIGPHGDVAASGSFVVPLRGTVQVAIATTANSVSLVSNNYADVILCPTTNPTAVLCGVSVSAIPVSNFGWIQVAGTVMCLTDGTVVIGQQLMPGANAAGSLMVQSTAESLTVPTVAICTRVATTTDYSTVCLVGLE